MVIESKQIPARPKTRSRLSKHFCFRKSHKRLKMVQKLASSRWKELRILSSVSGIMNPKNSSGIAVQSNRQLSGRKQPNRRRKTKRDARMTSWMIHKREKYSAGSGSRKARTLYASL